MKADVEKLLTNFKPKLIEAYRKGDATSYHLHNEIFIPLAHRIFMHLCENSNITWFPFEAFGSKLQNLCFWKYTDFVQSFCDYLELKNKEEANGTTIGT